MNTTLKVAIIGGGLVGPAAEIIFRHAGFANINVFEAARRPFPQSGGVMGLRRQSLTILDSIGVPPDATAALRDTHTYSYDIVAGSPQLRGAVNLPGQVTSWDKLHTQLDERAAVQRGKRVVAVHAATDRACLECADGTPCEADLMIFADGRKSFGRTLLAPERVFCYAGYVTWRGLVDHVPSQLHPHGFSRFYDVPGGSLFSLTEPVTGDGRFYWEFSHNLSADAYTTMTGGLRPTERAFLLPQAVTPTVRAVLTTQARACLPTMFSDIIAATDEVMAIPTNDVHTPTQAAYPFGSSWLVLVSDALQPVRLQTGMGLNAGLQQVHDLAQRLRSDRTLADVMREWEADTIGQIDPWVELGRSRAMRTNLGTYVPVRPGLTTAIINGGAFDTPQWVTA